MGIGSVYPASRTTLSTSALSPSVSNPTLDSLDSASIVAVAIDSKSFRAGAATRRTADVPLLRWTGRRQRNSPRRGFRVTYQTIRLTENHQRPALAALELVGQNLVPREFCEQGASKRACSSLGNLDRASDHSRDDPEP